MQWHPIFAHLVRPLVESYYELRTDQPVGDIPRQSDIVLLRKLLEGPPPFQGLWRRLTPWNVLEYKGPTVSPRFDELHDLVELGLGIHRRLNEQERKAQCAEVSYAETSFWYLVNHLGQRFLAELPTYLPDVRQETEGVWQATVFGHPLILVSVQELRVERDSLALHVLAGVPEAEQRTVADVLKAEPALWPSYGAWLAHREPAIWQEIVRMAAQNNQTIPWNYTPLAEYLRETGDRAGLKSFLEAVGVKQAVEAVGTEQLWAGFSPEQREELLRLARKDQKAATDPAE